MKLDFRPYPKQAQFLKSKKRYVGFVSGIGAGKTRCLAMKALIKALTNPGSFGCLTGPSFPLLRDTTKRTFLEVCPPELIAYRNDADNILGILTPSGQISDIIFRTTSDPDMLRGPNLLWAGMDEAALSDKEAFLILMGRIRSSPAEAQQLFVCSTPKGNNWVYDLFGPQQTDPEFECIYATTFDNIYLSSAYIDSLKRNYQGSFYQQELEGKFVAHEGLIYGDLFDYDVHLGTFPFDERRPIELGWDFGYPAFESVIAIQQNSNGSIWIPDSVYRQRVLTEDIAAEIRAKPWSPNITDCICDSSRPDLIERLSNLGIPARPCERKNILDGIAKVRSLLAIDNITKEPILHIDKSHNDELIKEFMNWRWKDKKTEEDNYRPTPIDAWNHGLDALTYWATTKYQPKPFKGFSKKPKTKRIFKYQLL